MRGDLKRQIMQVAGDMREEAKTKLNNAEIIEKLANMVDCLNDDEIHEFAAGLEFSRPRVNQESYLLMVNSKLEKTKSRK